MKSIIITLLLVLMPVYAQAAIHYVSPTGSASWANSTNISTPTDIATAFANAAAGDTVNFRGGTYTVPALSGSDGGYDGYYCPMNSGTSGSPIVFQAYTGETPIINGTAGSGSCGANPSGICTTSIAVGAGMYCAVSGYGTATASPMSYITISGFTFQCGISGGNSTCFPRLFIGSDNDPVGGPYTTSNITVQNNTIAGPPSGTLQNTGDDNLEGIRLNMVNTALIHGNTIYNFYQNTDYKNTACTKAYHTAYITYENNEIYNSTNGIFDKSGGDHNVYRYNFIHGIRGEAPIIVDESSYPQTNGSIYHNLIVNNAYEGITVRSENGGQGSGNDTWSIYNNTIYAPDSTTPGEGCLMPYSQDTAPYLPKNYSIYNNIIQCQQDSDYSTILHTNNDPTSGLITGGLGLDYNDYGSHMSVRLVSGGSGTNYTSLSSLRAASAYNLTTGNHDQHSIAMAPTFVNTSGNLNQIADFALTSGSAGHAAGYGGVDMGANVSLVGTGGSGVTQYTITTSPGSNGSLSCSPNPVNSGSTSTCTAVPSGGYYTSSMSGCGGTWSSGNSMTTGAITQACTVSASFTLTSSGAAHFKTGVGAARKNGVGAAHKYF